MRWTIAASALSDYRRLSECGSASDDDLRWELIDLAESAHQITQRTPRADGLDVWRTGQPQRCRLIVRQLDDASEVVHVEAAHRGGRLRRRGGRGFGRLGGQLRRHREQLGYDVDTVAKLAGVDASQVEQLEDDRSDPLQALDAICRALRLRIAVETQMRSGAS